MSFGFYWLWDFGNEEWTIGKKVVDQWLLLDRDGEVKEEELLRDFVIGEKLEEPPIPKKISHNESPLKGENL